MLKRLTASPAISLSTVSYIYWDNYVYYTDYLQAIHYFAQHVPDLFAYSSGDVIFCLVEGTIIVVELFGQRFTRLELAVLIHEVIGRITYALAIDSICASITHVLGIKAVDYFAGCLVDEINMNVVGRRSIERIVHSAINVK